MKKSLIATGAASLALAAMPVVGVFAVDGPVQVVDTVRVTIDESCTFEATQGGATVTPTGSTNPKTINRTFAKDATLGSVVILAGAGDEGVPSGVDPITVVAACNSDGTGGGKTGTYSITAASSQTMTGTGSAVIPNSTAGNETLTSGGTSAWSMRIVAPSTGIQNSYGSYHVMPDSTGDVVLTGTASSTDVTFTPEYRVYVGTDQASGTYTGTVTYTIASTWN